MKKKKMKKRAETNKLLDDQIDDDEKIPLKLSINVKVNSTATDTASSSSCMRRSLSFPFLNSSQLFRIIIRIAATQFGTL